MENYDRKVNIRAGNKELTAYVNCIVSQQSGDRVDLVRDNGEPVHLEFLEAIITETGIPVAITEEIKKKIIVELTNDKG
jgi:D-ribose pyranose/furanose isomerase RbsD